MADETETPKRLFTASFYMKGGSVIVIDNFTELTWTRTGEEITKLSWTQDLARGSAPQLGFISLGQIEALLSA